MQAQASIESFYRRYAPRVRATLIRRLGDFDSAEDALQDAFAEAHHLLASDRNSE